MLCGVIGYHWANKYNFLYLIHMRDTVCRIKHAAYWEHGRGI